MKKMLTIKETSQVTGLSEYAIRLGIHQHRYPFLKVGRKYLIDYATFIEVLRKQQLDNILTTVDTSQNAVGHCNLREI